MKKLAFVVLAVICFVSFIGSVYAATLTKGDVVYARSNLRAKISRIFWYSMSSAKIVIPVGTEVRIGGISTQYGELMITKTNDGKQYYIFCRSKQWDKYFVKDKKEIGLEGLSLDKKDQIENGTIAVGMSKKEVYASKGCPAYSTWGKKSEGISFDEIMQSDKWYYMKNQRGKDVMVTFANGVVIRIGGFEK